MEEETNFAAVQEQDEPTGDFSDIKKLVKKKQKKVQRQNQIFEQNDEGKKKTIFDVSEKEFIELKAQLDPQHLNDLKPILESCQENKVKYMKHLEDRQLYKGPNRIRPQINDLLYYPSKPTQDKIDQIIESPNLVDVPDRATLEAFATIWSKRPCTDQKTITLMDQLGDQTGQNLSNVIRSVRKLSVVLMCVQSPFLVYEMDDLVDEWAKTLETLLRDKFKKEPELMRENEQEDNLNATIAEDLDENLNEQFFKTMRQPKNQ